MHLYVLLQQYAQVVCWGFAPCPDITFFSGLSYFDIDFQMALP